MKIVTLLVIDLGSCELLKINDENTYATYFYHEKDIHH